MLRVICVIYIIYFISACSENDSSSKAPEITIPQVDLASSPIQENSNIDYELLRQKITYGKASLSEVRQAMTDQDIGRITNTIHALYSLRWHRGVINMLDDMWALNNTRYPEIAWELFDKPPVKLALASTINRIKIYDTSEYLNYLYNFKYDEHEFHRAQVIIALAFNADPKDVDYLKEMADSDNRYVTQSAVTGLGLMGGEKAKLALGQLWKKHKDTPRGDLIVDVLESAYKQSPSLEKPNPENESSIK